MQYAKTEPTIQHHTAVAGPPAESGKASSAGTEPRTPRMDVAYDAIDHLVNSRRSSCNGSARGQRKAGLCAYLLIADLSEETLVAIMDRGHADVMACRRSRRRRRLRDPQFMLRGKAFSLAWRLLLARAHRGCNRAVRSGAMEEGEGIATLIMGRWKPLEHRQIGQPTRARNEGK